MLHENRSQYTSQWILDFRRSLKKVRLIKPDLLGWWRGAPCPFLQVWLGGIKRLALQNPSCRYPRWVSWVLTSCLWCALVRPAPVSGLQKTESVSWNTTSLALTWLTYCLQKGMNGLLCDLLFFLPRASSFSRCTDTRRDSFSSSSLSRKAFLSIAWFKRPSKSSRDTIVALHIQWVEEHSVKTFMNSTIGATTTVQKVQFFSAQVYVLKWSRKNNTWYITSLEG